MSENSRVHEFTVGLFGIGLDAYWPQFEGLQQRLTGYTQQIAQRLEKPGVRVINLGLVDSPEKAETAGHAFRRHDVDLIFLYVTTYALSSTVLPVVRRAKVPVILLNLSPSAAIDYKSFNRMGDRTRMTGEWLAYCQAWSVPEISNVFRRFRIPFFQVTGILENDPFAWNEISSWIDAGRVAHTMEHNRLGVMGHYYGGMLDIYSDLTQQCAYFGGHIEMLEVDELADLRRRVSTKEISSRVQNFRETFDVQPDCPPVELERAARTSVALDRLIAIAQGKTKVRPLGVYHGKVGRGLSVEMSIKHGPVTLLAVVQTADGRLKLLVADAVSEPGPILEIGNTNSRYRFSMGARAFMNAWNAEGSAHHCAIGIGHISSKLSKLGQLLGMECTVIG